MGLQTKEPHYLPRYTGFLPQYKYRIGKTYGRHSVEILSDNNVKKSGNLVLQPLNFGKSNNTVDRRREILSSRSVRFGSKTLRADMLPGYTGYIPKNQHYFAKRYGEICRSSLAQHEVEQQENKKKQKEIQQIFQLQTGEKLPLTAYDKSVLLQKQLTPLKPIARTPKKHHFPVQIPTHGSPYSLPNDDENKWFKTGFTGFVPHTRDLIALDYKRQCETGLKSFSDHQKLIRSQPRTVEGIPPSERPQTETKHNIYPVDRGMLPAYTGYIPGYKYMIGRTYGQDTYNILKLPSSP